MIEPFGSIYDIKPKFNELIDTVNKLSAEVEALKPKDKDYCGCSVPCKPAEKSLAEVLYYEAKRFGYEMNNFTPYVKHAYESEASVAKEHILKKVEELDITTLLYLNWNTKTSSEAAANLVKDSIRKAIV